MGRTGSSKAAFRDYDRSSPTDMLMLRDACSGRDGVGWPKRTSDELWTALCGWKWTASLSSEAIAERAMAMWPNNGETDPRPTLGSPYLTIPPVRPNGPVVDPSVLSHDP